MNKKKLTALKIFLFSNKIILITFISVLFIFLINTFHTNFPDEYDNILGGYYITHGILPYKGFFSHHGPVAYYFASLITIFTKNSFVFFRIILAIVYSAFLLGSYFLLKRRLKLKIFYEFLLFSLLLGFAAVYFWGHMLLADPLSGYILIPAYILILIKTFRKAPLDITDLSIISILTALSFFNSITYSYIVIIFNVYALFIYFLQNKNQVISLKSLKIIFIFLIPYIFFLFYFLITGSLSQYYNQAILYNKNTYVYNYPRPAGSTTLNPIRYAIVIIHDFLNNYRGLLEQVKDFNFSYPFNITLAIADLSLLIYLLVNRKFSLFFFVLATLIFTNPRSNPLNSKETDFQSAVYIMFSLFNISYVLYSLKNDLSNNPNYFKKVIFAPLFGFLSLYSLFFFLFIFNGFFEKAYQKYMGTAPLIYDRPQIAPIINQLITKDDYFWIGPHEFEELLFIQGKLPSKYHWFLRAHSETPNIKVEMMNDLRKNKPKIIVYKKDFSSFGQDPQSLNSLLSDFLDNEYFQMGSIGTKSSEYKAKIKDIQNFNINEQFYFDKNRKEEIVNQLIKANIIEKNSSF